MVTSKDLVNRKPGEVALDTRPEALMITPEYVETQKRSLALLQGMVRDVLVSGRDYGHVPGIPGDFLWDPGASQIIGSFNCYVGERRIKSLVDDGSKIAVVIEAPILSFNSGREVGSGIGASSTYETKHKYRWVENPKEWGFDEEATKTLKHKTDDGRTKYRIPNPEHGELLNTIIKIASKRAECDAAEGLPGVASALRELFTSRGGAPKRKEPDWATFYAQGRQMGLTDDEIHEGLGVSSNLEWIKQGKTIKDAQIKLADWLAERGKKTGQASRVQVIDGQTGEILSEGPLSTLQTVKWPPRDPVTITDWGPLYAACGEDFGLKTRRECWDEVNARNQEELEKIGKTPAECYAEIAAVRKPPHPE